MASGTSFQTQSFNTVLFSFVPRMFAHAFECCLFDTSFYCSLCSCVLGRISWCLCFEFPICGRFGSQLVRKVEWGVSSQLSQNAVYRRIVCWKSFRLIPFSRLGAYEVFLAYSGFTHTGRGYS